MKTIVSIGKRKKAVARAILRKGSGIIRINKILVDAIKPEVLRLRLLEPILLAGEDVAKNLNISINVKGGGFSAQIDAARTAIARGIIEYLKEVNPEKADKIRELFLKYDRTLLVPDTRRTEPQKPYRSAARRLRQTSKR